jgi:hypothetical protein
MQGIRREKHSKQVVELSGKYVHRVFLFLPAHDVQNIRYVESYWRGKGKKSRTSKATVGLSLPIFLPGFAARCG